jgi:hypothetical protein
MPMQPIHRLADLGQRPDGGIEWACPRCGRYLVRYPDRQLVVAAGAPGPATSSAPGTPTTHRDPDDQQVRRPVPPPPCHGLVAQPRTAPSPAGAPSVRQPTITLNPPKEGHGGRGHQPPARRFDEEAIALHRSVADGQDPRSGRHDRPAPTVRNPHPTTAPPQATALHASTGKT